MMKRAQEQLSKETDIVGMIRSRRFFNLAIEHLLQPSIQQNFKVASRYKDIVESARIELDNVPFKKYTLNN